MSELLPPVHAERVRTSLRDYLTTTFALTDFEVQEGLDRFLSDRDSGMFKGPYVRLWLPFRPADEGWRDSLEWFEGFPPYGHQAAAFARLSSMIGGVRRRPQPTLVTTGTGSGKTEAFLYPIIDHALRARRDGITGVKALILYPMNALANDQAARLTQILSTRPELRGLTAALYTGQSGTQRTSVTADGLITDRAIIRDTPPDILLTNYKMLDQLLLRAADQKLWKASAASLQYLVLDEFHTYDGAQGTDVAMLLRRLGMALKSHWPADDASFTDAERARPLGRITPVATSATLGDKGDPTVMLGFAETVFGETFGADAVVGETRMSVDEWADVGTELVPTSGLDAISVERLDIAAANRDLAELGDDPAGSDVARAMFGALYAGALPTGSSDDLLLALTQAHPLIRAVADAAADAISLADLVTAVVPARVSTVLAGTGSDGEWETFLSHLVACLGHVRAMVGRRALSVDVHLWVRELTRIDRTADATTQFRWGDDGPAVAGTDARDVRPSFPAVFCRECGRSGWGVGLAPVGNDLTGDDATIRRQHASREGRFRALLYAPSEGDAALLDGTTVDGLMWFSARSRQLSPTTPDPQDEELRDGWVLPVITSAGTDADDLALTDTCPSCGQADAIRFLGSAIATLLSVSLSTLFGSGELDAREKKALVFTDSVQDAAHRAGFVQARSHTLTLRAVWREAVADGPLTLEALVDEVVQRAGDDPVARYRILSPDCADRDSFTAFWQAARLRAVPAAVRTRVRKRLALDALLEFGLNSRTGRTLELTGSAAASVDAGHPEKLAAIGRAVLDSFAVQLSTKTEGGVPTDKDVIRWVRGVLERMRTQGAVDHPWFAKYRMDDGNRWSIWGGRPRSEGMPAFPGARSGRSGRPAPAYPRIGPVQDKARDSGLDAVTSAQSWFARWASRVLTVSAADGARLSRLLLERLAADGVLTTVQTASKATVYAIPPSHVVVGPTADADLREGRHLLQCRTCHAQYPGAVEVVEQLNGAPCLVVRCDGQLERAAMIPGFYRSLYSSPDMRRIVAREHTSLLEDETRRAYEDGFRGSATDPQAPNVLVATPTLEMGIDIGDLSTVMLASLPRTVASYLQRVGRAGRLTGNALNLAYVTGRGEHLPKLGEPLSVINGEVRPPATYLQAEEILKRQFTAHLMDEFARDSTRKHPQKATGAIGSSEPDTFLGDLIVAAEDPLPAHVDHFLASFGSLPPDVVHELHDWVVPVSGVATSRFAGHVDAASRRWQSTVEELGHRLDRIETLLPELEKKQASSASTSDDVKAWRSAVATRAMTAGQLGRLRGEYWIAVLEEYGLLPNYTLLDDTVLLDVGLSWVDPDTGSFQSESAQFSRASSVAIREFAPGATFYARGWEIAIDAVDLGADASGIRPWAFCAGCGYGADITAGGVEKVPAVCPRCGSADISDTGQRMDVVELTHVSAEVRRDEATIGDRDDERQRASFQIVPTVDVDPARIARRWFAENTGIGCTYAREIDVRWLNIGQRGHGQEWTIAGEQRSGALFRVCAGCGKLDLEAGRNSAYEHRPWCKFRASAEEHNRLVALSRTLHTQGLLIRLPYTVTIGDDFAIPSLSAAVLLGLREQIGGHPDHLRIERVVDPTFGDGHANHDALLLHDVVPGGTGYLAELATPEQLKGLLVTAWERVRDCECRLEDRLACHRCLLPFAAGTALNQVSRSAAERHLRTLLGVTADATTVDDGSWTITEVPPPEDPESHLEQRFRKVLRERLVTAGASVKEVPGPTGNTVVFTLAGSPRQWTLTPQLNLENSKPDFVLSCNDTNVPKVAIFTDGRAFHAVPAHNRLADDAEKRAILRLSGHLVLGISAHDVTKAEKGEDTAVDWFNQGVLPTLMTRPSFMASPSAYDRLRRGPVDWLIAWVAEPDHSGLQIAARAVPLALSGPPEYLPVSATRSLELIAHDVITGVAPEPGDRMVIIWRSGSMALVAAEDGTTVPAALVLDDRTEHLDEAHADGWRMWLALANAMSGRSWPTVITTTSLVSAGTATSKGRQARPEMPKAWERAYDAALSDLERSLLLRLAQRGGAVPVMGHEGPEGIPLDLAWPDLKIAVTVEGFDADDRRDLAAAGWRVITADFAAIVAALETTDRTGSN